MRLVAEDDRLYVTLGYHAPVSELDAKTGEILKTYRDTEGTREIIYYDGRLILTVPRDQGLKLVALNAETGEQIWETKNSYRGTTKDYLSWNARRGVKAEPFELDAILNPACDGKSISFIDDRDLVGLDFHTGEELWRTKGPEEKTSLWMGAMIVKDGVMLYASRRGTEYVDLKAGNHTVHNWVRGTCHYGMLPANGLQYAPPHPCRCYILEKINGFNALAPEIPAKYRREDQDNAERLERGPAYGEIASAGSGNGDWPAFRHDSMRSGSTKAEVPERLDLLWNVKLGKELSAPIFVGDKVFIALADEHQVLALGTEDGRKLWNFYTGGRIDSPPTYHKGMLLFGSADGWVYCIRASDGQLAWRFHAAPEDRLMGAFDQLESAWPVN